MESINLTREEILNYPIFYKKKTTESVIREYNKKELLKIFKYLSLNKKYTLELMEKHFNDFKLIPELLIHKKYVYTDNQISGLLLDKGYDINLFNYAKTASFNDLILVLKNIGKTLEKLRYLREEEQIITTFYI